MSLQFFILMLVVLASTINSQVTNTTTPSPTSAPSKGCAYTVLPDDRLAKGVAVPLHTCIGTPFPLPGTSIYYKCNTNKTEVQMLQYTTSDSCDSTESIVINTTTAAEDFECDGDPCPSVNYVDRTWIETQDQECKDGGWDLGIGSYVINECTYYSDYSAITICDKNSITYTRYNGTTTCEEITDVNSTIVNNVKINTQTLGCQYRINPPYTPNGWIKSIRCPGYDYSEDGISTETLIIIIVASVGGLICCGILCVLFYFYCKKNNLTRRYTEYEEVSN